MASCWCTHEVLVFYLPEDLVLFVENYIMFLIFYFLVYFSYTGDFSLFLKLFYLTKANLVRL